MEPVFENEEVSDFQFHGVGFDGESEALLESPIDFLAGWPYSIAGLDVGPDGSMYVLAIVEDPEFGDGAFEDPLPVIVRFGPEGDILAGPTPLDDMDLSEFEDVEQIAMTPWGDITVVDDEVYVLFAHANDHPIRRYGSDLDGDQVESRGRRTDDPSVPGDFLGPVRFLADRTDDLAVMDILHDENDDDEVRLVTFEFDSDDRWGVVEWDPGRFMDE